MKIRKRIAIAISVLLVLVLSVFALADSADATEYTGTTEEVMTLIGNYDKANSAKGKLKALDEAIAYLATVDPESEGISEVHTELDKRILNLATVYLDELGAMTATEDKHTARDGIESFLTLHPFYTEMTEQDDYLASLGEATSLIAEEYLARLKTESDPDARHATTDKVYLLISSYSPTLRNDFGGELLMENFDTARAYLLLADGETSSARLGALIRQIDGFLRDHYVESEPDELEAFENALSGVRLEYASLKADAFLKTHNAAHLKDFNSPIRVDRDFDTKVTGVLTPMGNTSNGVLLSYVGEDSGMDGENKYYTVRFDKEKTHVRTSMDLTSVKDAAVIEFDITTFDRLPDRCIWFEDVGRANGTSWSIMYFSITPEGHIATDAAGSDIIFKNAIIPGQWAHISLTVEHSTGDIKLYLDYELIYETNKCHPTYGYTYSPETLIIGANPTTKGASVSFDNVQVYTGHSPRDIYVYNSLSDEGLFLHYVSEIDNSDLTPKARKEYYDSAKSALSSYYSEGVYLTDNVDINNAVDKLLAFDYDALRVELGDKNLDGYSKLFDKLSSIAPGEKTLSLRKYWLAACDSFLGSTGGIITSGELHSYISEKIAEERYRIDIETMADEFTMHVNAFYSASTVALKKTSCESALSLLEYINLEVLGDKSLYPSFYQALELSYEMENILYETVCIDNSKKLLACVQYVMQCAPEREDWDASYDKLKGYVAQARVIIAGGQYDKYYRELYKVLEDFAPMNEYFYGRLQESHREHIISELARFDESTVFFERYGILVKLDEYISADDVDRDREDIRPLVERVERELVLIKDEEAEYDEILKENTEKFIKLCEGLLGSVDYATIKRIVTEASVYYYTMNVDMASCQDALAVYRVRRNELILKESVAEEFILLAEVIDTERDDALSMILDCYAYVDTVDRDVPGVDGALKLLEEKMAEYDASVEAVNSEIEGTLLASAYLRNISGFGSFITLIVSTMMG